jgi:glycosyltransferase involved in cell wall biosynthesis
MSRSRAKKNEPSVGHINLYCPAFGVADGYGHVAERLSLGLEDLGVKVTLAGSPRPAGHLEAERIFRAEREVAQTIVYLSQPTSWSRQGRDRRAIGFSMYECTELPAIWYEKLRVVDEIWVPCEWNRGIFQSLTDRPVSVVPFGVDAKAFKFKRRERGAKLRFLHFATVGSEYRKGADLAVAAFKAAFQDRDDVELVLRSTKPSMLQRDDPRVSILHGLVTTEKLADFYRNFDALIYPSRGEGFGLIPLEAMATGMPAIHSGLTGMAEYADLGLLVDARPTTSMVGVGDVGRFQKVGTWYEPLVDSIVDRLREIDTNYDAVMDKAESDAASIAAHWTWDRAARVFQARLERWDVPRQSADLSQRQPVQVAS